MKKSLFFLIALIMIVLVSCSPDVFSHEGQKVTVMVVGLDYAVRYNAVDYLKYKDGSKEYSIKPLKASMRDSKEVGAALDSIYADKSVDHEVIFMLSEGDHPDYKSKYYPSSANVINMLQNLELDEDDLFVFYYAGHGYFSGSEMYLITGDTESSNNMCTSVTSTKLLSTIRALPCRSVIILDSCFSGVADPGNSPSSDTLMYSINSIFNEKFNSESETKLTVMCASKWNEEAFENYSVKTTDGSTEEHGQFSGRLLSILGWNHSTTKTTVVNKGTDNEVVAYGESRGVRGCLSLDDIYFRIYDGWTYPNMSQHPILYYTNESINLIPAN